MPSAPFAHQLKAAARRATARWPVLRRAVVGGRVARGSAGFDDLPADVAVRVAYNVVLRRDPDPAGWDTYFGPVSRGELPREEFVDRLRGSDEFRFRVPFRASGALMSLHLSRCEFILGLPRARRILDLGGSHTATPQGAFVMMGYPYDFDELVIVDLPPEDRHELYHSDLHQAVATHRGPVRYAYHSMADLSSYDDGSFDLIYSGQSIEHVTPDEGDVVLKESYRVLRPGGWLGVDTPNARITRLQQDALIDPDHKVEYTHAEMVDKLTSAGFEIVSARGLNYCGRAAARGAFDMDEMAANTGQFADPEDCYLLAYVCRKPA